jgi:hypothetical protein
MLLHLPIAFLATPYSGFQHGTDVVPLASSTHERCTCAIIAVAAERHECAPTCAPQAPQWAPRDHRPPCGKNPSSLARGPRVLLVDTRRNEPLQRYRPLFWSTPAPSASNGELEGRLPPRFAGPRVRHRENEGIHGDHSGNPAFRRPSISSFAWDCLPRAIHADIVKAGSSSSIRAAASRASTLRPR